MGFASWEPPHGPYKSFRYPWAMYVKVGAAQRHCAFMVMALHGCIISEIQAAENKRQVFRNELQWVGVEGAKVLKQIGEKLKKMEKLIPNVDILHEVHQAAEVLQSKIDKKSYLLVNVAQWNIGYRDQDLTDELLNLDSDITQILAHKSQSESTIYPPGYWDTIYPEHLTPAANQQPSWPSRISLTPGSLLQPEHATNMYESASDLSLAAFASLLIEFVARLENLVYAYDELCEKSEFQRSCCGS